MNHDRIRDPKLPRSTGETVGVTVVASGPQAVTVYAAGTGPGAHIAVVTPHVMVTVHDRQALQTYSSIWSDMRSETLHLPQHRVVTIDQAAQRMPGLVIVAHGRDRAVGIRRAARNDIAIRIGYVTWILADILAFRSMTEAWEHAHDAGLTHLPKTSAPPKVQGEHPTARQRIFPTAPSPEVPAPKERKLTKYDELLAYLESHRTDPRS